MSIKEYQLGNTIHIPVLLDETVRLLSPQKGERYLDLTAGYGGHAGVMLEKTGNFHEAVLVDRDENAIKSLSSFSTKGVTLMHLDFGEATKRLVESGQKFDMILVDLGVSSPQLDRNERGFSFTNDGPLDMRMDQRQEKSAKTLVNTASVNELARIINSYGEEPMSFSLSVARAIAESRPIESTGELASLIKDLYRGKWKKTHPATRTFQAIRIAVNDELKQVEDMLPNLPRLLKTGGRVGIISFHSLEDRIVKRYFKQQFDAGLESELQPITKKPIAGDIYDVHNPRSRSAKLRVAVKK